MEGPGGVDHDKVAAGAGHAVEQGEQAVVDHLEGTQEQTVGDVVWVVEPRALMVCVIRGDSKQVVFSYKHP